MTHTRQHNNDTAATRIPGFCIAGTQSGAGKTTVTLGLLAALSRRVKRVQPFKCGPDYIDPGHHRLACGSVSRNLDSWMMGEEAVQNTFKRAAAAADAVVVEGVMGLFDGASPDALVGSTAHICMLLDLPVILVVDAKSMARSIAALVHGFATFEPGLKIAGVIANKVGSERHQEILTRALSAAGLPPLLGALPRRQEWAIPERHLGLIASSESRQDQHWFQSLADGVEKYIDLNALPSIQRPVSIEQNRQSRQTAKARLAIAQDAAFHFYYEDNLDALRAAGAELVPFSPLLDKELPPDVQGLYIGGGFPEMFCDKLAANRDICNAIRNFAHKGGWVYAECGGYMYLCEKLTDSEGQSWPMAAVLPLQTHMQSQRRRLGYVEVQTCRSGLFGPAGTALRGHEFHWSALDQNCPELEPLYDGFYLRSPQSRKNFGVRWRNVCASYVHLYFPSSPTACRHLIDTVLGEILQG